MLPSLVTSTPAIDLGPHRRAVLTSYYSVILLGGFLGVPLVIAAELLGRRARRRPAFLNLLLSWIFYASASLLLFFSGDGLAEQIKPSFRICLLQAASVYGGSILVVVSNAVLLTQLWLDLRGSSATKDSRLMAVSLLGLPWVCSLGPFLASIYIGLQEPTLVSIRWSFYCTISSASLTRTVSGMTLGCLTILLIFEVSILRSLYRSSRELRKMNYVSYKLSIRVTAFTAYSFLIFSISIILTFHPTMITPYMIVATSPVAVFLFFGTQEENIRLCRKMISKELPVGRCSPDEPC